LKIKGVNYLSNKTHWKKLTNPNYLGAYSFNEGEEKILTIKSVSDELVKGEDGKEERCIVARFVEPEKPMILNKTNCKTIQKVYKTPYIEDWANRKIQIYVEQVKAFGDVVEALRIRKFIPKVAAPKAEAIITCADCGQTVKAYGKMNPAQIAKMTYEKYGKQLCTDCAAKEKARQLEADRAAALTEQLDAITDEAEPNTAEQNITETEKCE
jgi:hypothetical protein